MIKNNINIRRVLEAFLKEPDRTFKYDDLIYLREYTGESRIREALRNLSKDEIIDVTRLLGRPRKGGDTNSNPSGKKRQNHKIRQDLITFKKIFDIFNDNNLETLLKSNYTNNIMKDSGLAGFHLILGKDLESSGFRKIASRAFLSLPATIDNFEYLGKSIRDFIFTEDLNKVPVQNGKNTINWIELDKSWLKEMEPIAFLPEGQPEMNPQEQWTYIRKNLYPFEIEEIRLLSSYDPLDAVELCRKTLNKYYVEVYRSHLNNGFITKGLQEFMELDNHLSPLTSYPANSPKSLIFSRPFQRIYDDVFLLNETDFQKFIYRAYAIYNRFEDILFEFFDNNFEANCHIHTLTKEFIFYWNVSSFAFDLIFKYIYKLYHSKIGSGKYHLKYDGLIFRIFDLENNQPVLNRASEIFISNAIAWPRVPEPLEKGENILRYMESPFTSIRTCLPFQKEDQQAETTSFEDMVSRLQKRINLHS